MHHVASPKQAKKTRVHPCFGCALGTPKVSASTSARILCKKVCNRALLCRLSWPRMEATPKGKMFMLNDSKPRSGKPDINRLGTDCAFCVLILSIVRPVFGCKNIRKVPKNSAGSRLQPLPASKGSSSPQLTSSHFSRGTESSAVSLLGKQLHSVTSYPLCNLVFIQFDSICA